MSRGRALEVARAIEFRSHTLITVATAGIADRGAQRARVQSSPGGVALLQRERWGARALKLVRHANDRRIAGIRAGIAARGAARDVVDEAALSGIADLRIRQVGIALVLADHALARAVARVTQGGRRAGAALVHIAGEIRAADLWLRASARRLSRGASNARAALSLAQGGTDRAVGREASEVRVAGDRLSAHAFLVPRTAGLGVAEEGRLVAERAARTGRSRCHPAGQV